MRFDADRTILEVEPRRKAGWKTWGISCLLVFIGALVGVFILWNTLIGPWVRFYGGVAGHG